MEITLTLTFEGPDASERASEYLTRYLGEQKVSPPAAGLGVLQPEEKPKRGKKTKPETVGVDHGRPGGDTTAAVTVVTEKDGTATVKSVATQADAQKAIETLFNAKGLPTARDVLSRYGVQRLQDMKPEHYGEFIAHADRVLKGGEV